MHELLFLKSLVILLGISAFVVFILHRAKIPSIIGFLIAGVILGPHGLHFIRDADMIQTFAEIGVILLLFTIGLEFSLSRFLKMRMEVFGVGGLQVLTTSVLTALIAYVWFGVADLNTAVFLGFLVALSSTAIVMKLLSDRAELDSPHGRISIGILIFQDLCVVPFMLFIPILTGGSGIVEIALALVKAVVIIVVVLLSSKWLVPVVLHQIVLTRNRELFIISILIICFGIAFITSEFGLSLALGAFLAGLVISESEFVHEAVSSILPFRDSFNGLFFISVGMLLDSSFLAGNATLVFLLFTGIIMLKFASCFFSMSILKRPLRTSLQSAMNLAQVGEFSFVLAVAGLSAGLISSDIYQSFLSAAVLTMLLTPLITRFSPVMSDRLSSSGMIKMLAGEEGLAEPREAVETLTDHTIIVGFGLNGRNLARVLKEAGITYVALELNISTVRDIKKRGEPIYYGDGTKIEVLHTLGLQKARILVVAISDPASCRNIVRTARKENPELFIIARTRYASEVDDLIRLGADEVIPEEFETSIEIFSRVLGRYQIPRNEIFDLVDMIREDGYRALRQPAAAAKKPLFGKDSGLSKVNVELFTVNKSSPVLGRSIEGLRFRTRTGATIIAVERGDRVFTSPVPDFRFNAGDVVFITGKREDINRALVYLSDGEV